MGGLGRIIAVHVCRHTKKKERKKKEESMHDRGMFVCVHVYLFELTTNKRTCKFQGHKEPRRLEGSGKINSIFTMGCSAASPTRTNPFMHTAGLSSLSDMAQTNFSDTNTTKQKILNPTCTPSCFCPPHWFNTIALSPRPALFEKRWIYQ